MSHRGGGHKRRYRVIDWKRNKFDVVGTVERLEYDPNRTAFIALVKYDDGEKETFMLLRGPFRRNSDKAILMPAPEGEYRIEWEEVRDVGRN